MAAPPRADNERVIAKVGNMVVREATIGRLLKRKVYELDLKLDDTRMSFKLTKDEFKEFVRKMLRCEPFSLRGRLYDVEFKRDREGFLLLYKENGGIKQFFIPVKLNYKHLMDLLRLLVKAYKKLFSKEN